MPTPPAPTLVDDRLAWWAEHTPDGEAMTYLDRSWTWAEWDERVRRAAGGLQALGVGRGDVVAFLDKNHPACVEVSLAAASRGAASAIVNWRSAGDEVDYAVNDSGARVLFVGAELVPSIEAIRDRLPTVEKVVTHRNMVRHAVNAHDGWVFEPGDKSMVSMPLFHVGGSPTAPSSSPRCSPRCSSPGPTRSRSSGR